MIFIHLIKQLIRYLVRKLNFKTCKKSKTFKNFKNRSKHFKNFDYSTISDKNETNQTIYSPTKNCEMQVDEVDSVCYEREIELTNITKAGHPVGDPSQFALLQILGEGSFGKVWLGE